MAEVEGGLHPLISTQLYKFKESWVRHTVAFWLQVAACFKGEVAATSSLAVFLYRLSVLPAYTQSFREWVETK